jgi:hypothetical protein
MSSDHQLFINKTTLRLLDSSLAVQGNGYFDSHRLTTPASKAAGTFSLSILLRILKAFFSPRGLVLGRIGDIVVEVSSVCSSRKLQRQSTTAVYVGRSTNRLEIVDRATEELLAQIKVLMIGQDLRARFEIKK